MFAFILILLLMGIIICERGRKRERFIVVRVVVCLIVRVYRGLLCFTDQIDVPVYHLITYIRYT